MRPNKSRPKARQKLGKLCAALRAVMWFGEHDQPYATGDLKLAVVGRRSPRIPHR
jgi:hypothetical protein